MPWWQELVYREGLLEEFAGQPPAEDTVTAEEDAEDVDDEAQSGSLESFGFNVIPVQFG